MNDQVKPMCGLPWSVWYYRCTYLSITRCAAIVNPGGVPCLLRSGWSCSVLTRANRDKAGARQRARRVLVHTAGA